MGGGLMQLVAYGAQDIYLTGNPQITFFKVVYRRHTNFSMEAIKQTFDGEFSTGGSSVDCIISRNGDLIYNMWLEVLFAAPTGNLTGSTSAAAPASATYFNWTNNVGHAFIKDCEIEIGGQKIDKLNSQWLDIWNELTDKDKDLHLGLGKNSSKHSYLDTNEVTDISTGFAEIATNLERRSYIHLPFWYCKNVGLALPLIALQYHEVKLKLSTRNLLSLLNTNATSISNQFVFSAPDVKLWVDYIYLDTDERRRFAQVSHEYLIEQLQVESKSLSTDNSKFKMSLDFNHPVKELIWVNQKNNNVAEETAFQLSHGADATIPSENAKNDYFNYLSNDPTASSAGKSYIEYINGQKSIEGFDKMTLKLNGHDRFEKRNASYFRLCQPYQSGHKIPEKHIYCYSFALKPQEHQPSGTCNFSRIDDAEMIFDAVAVSTANTMTCYAINYNVLRIMSGMGGLAYSN